MDWYVGQIPTRNGLLGEETQDEHFPDDYPVGQESNKWRESLIVSLLAACLTAEFLQSHIYQYSTISAAALSQC